MKVIDLIKELRDFGCNVDVYDPIANKDLVIEEYGIDLTNKQEDIKLEKYIQAYSEPFLTRNLKIWRLIFLLIQ